MLITITRSVKNNQSAKNRQEWHEESNRMTWPVSVKEKSQSWGYSFIAYIFKIDFNEKTS